MFPVLHLVRIKGVVPNEELLGLASAAELEGLVEGGLLVDTGAGLMLSDSGFGRHAEHLAEERLAIDLSTVAASYDRFLTVNQGVKDACAAWQHSGGDADALFGTIGALSDYLDRARPALKRTGSVVPRFLRYAERLGRALDQASGGDGRYLTSLDVDSFHNVWFECHEDYLLTLGRSREEEGNA